MKKVYYHAITMDKMVSIMRKGLIPNPSDNGTYFTDDAISSLDWIKCREELYQNRKHKSLGLISFEVDTDDKFLFPIKDWSNDTDVNYPQLWKEAQKSEVVIYEKFIHPSQLTFEECFIDGDEYDCYEKVNNTTYVPYTLSDKISIMVNGMKNVCSYDYTTKKYFNQFDGFIKQLQKDNQLQIELYNHTMNTWKQNPRVK
jgi:hypothetical protein